MTHQHSAKPARDEEFWDELYRGQEQIWSGAPNGVLVVEVAGMPPGRVLDVGSGEGGDANWLAGRGWQVTAVDISQVALDRAKSLVPGDVTWTLADLTRTPPAAGAYDLVSAQYFPIARDAGAKVVRGLAAAVAPGGTFLFVFHDPADVPEDNEHGFRPEDFYQPHEIAELLDDTWEIQVNETRDRTVPPPPGTHHVRDTILRARRKS
jgi:SAM-dependent methyltransferase